MEAFFYKHCKNATALKERGANSNVPNSEDRPAHQSPTKQGVQQAGLPSSKQQKKKRRQQKAKAAQSTSPSSSPERTPSASADSFTDRASQSSAAQDQSMQQPAPQTSVTPDSEPASKASAPVADQRSPEQQQAEAAKDLGNTHYKAGQYEAALLSYGKAIELCPETAAYYGNRAAAALMKRQYKLAVQDCLQATKLNTSFARGYQRAGMFLCDIHILCSMHSFVLQLLVLCCKSWLPHVLESLTSMHFFLVCILKALLRLPCKGWSTLHAPLVPVNNTGKAYLCMGQLDEADSQYRRALELEPGNAGIKAEAQLVDAVRSNLRLGRQCLEEGDARHVYHPRSIPACTC